MKPLLRVAIKKARALALRSNQFVYPLCDLPTGVVPRLKASVVRLTLLYIWRLPAALAVI